MAPPVFIEEADYLGVTVTCSEERWRSKVVAVHPDMQGKDSLIRAAIRDPDLVLQDRGRPSRKHHLRQAADGRHMMVVVEYDYGSEPVRGRLVTAFTRRRRRRGDVLLYSRGGKP